jgi:hypothetical protein
MGSANAPESWTFFEPAPAPLMYVSGAVAIEYIDDQNVLITWYNNLPAHDDVPAERHISLRLIFPASAVPGLVRQLAALQEEAPKVGRVLDS